jgi:uncharacterized protein YcfL
MKTLSLLALVFLLIVSGCKKDYKYRDIQIQVTVPSNTTFDIRIVNGGVPVLSETNSSTNLTTTILAKSGDKLAVAYQFVTQSQQNGQGLATFTYNGQVLLTINGGNGNQTVSVP